MGITMLLDWLMPETTVAASIIEKPAGTSRRRDIPTTSPCQPLISQNRFTTPPGRTAGGAALRDRVAAGVGVKVAVGVTVGDEVGEGVAVCVGVADGWFPDGGRVAFAVGLVVGVRDAVGVCVSGIGVGEAVGLVSGVFVFVGVGVKSGVAVEASPVGAGVSEGGVSEGDASEGVGVEGCTCPGVASSMGGGEKSAGLP